MDRFVFILLGAALFGGCAPDLEQGGGAGGMGGASSSSTGGAGGPACMVDGDCMNDECRTNGKCTDGTCKFELRPAGWPIANPDYGDCMALQCDSMGNVVSVDITPKDSYVYSNKCYAPDCSQGTNPKAAQVGTTCDTPWGKPGLCDDMANCLECTDDVQCSAPTPHCASGRCVAGATCMDGIKNVGEADIDCGGPCPPCQGGKACLSSTDCDSKFCAGNMCKMPACDDSFKNGDETDEDCGGSCATIDPPMKCANGKVCLFPYDCQSGKCEGGTCAP